MLVVASLLLLGGGVVATDLDPENKILDRDLLDRLAQGESAVNVIVLLSGYQDYVRRVDADAPSRIAAVQSEIASRQADVLDRLDSSQFELKHRFDNILGFSGRATVAGIRALLAMPEVEVIEEDEIEHMTQTQGISLRKMKTIGGSEK